MSHPPLPYAPRSDGPEPAPGTRYVPMFLAPRPPARVSPDAVTDEIPAQAADSRGQRAVIVAVLVTAALLLLVAVVIVGLAVGGWVGVAER